MSRPDPLNPPRPSPASISLDQHEGSELEDGLSLAELATALSAHGGGALSADLALDLVLNEIVEHARLATGATAAAIALARGDEIVCRATTGANAPDLGVRLDVHSGLSGACVQSKKWQRCDDTETDSRVDAEVCRGLGVRSILVFPVVKKDELLGVCEIFSPRPNAFSDREIQTLEALSRSIVNNVDRAVDVLSPPVPAFASSLMGTAIAPAEVESVERVQADPAQVQRARSEGPQTTPETSEVSLPALDSSPAISTSSKIQPRDHWLTILTLAVIALALFLGWMMGYVRRQGGTTGTKAKVNATVPPAQANAPEAAALSASPAVRASDPPARVNPAPAPVSSPQSDPPRTPAAAPPPGGLVVYENGKVIFQTPPQTSHHSSKDAGSQPVKVPSKVADEYLVQRVEPEYPEQARDQHVQGPVVLEALVGKDGAVERLRTVSGDSQLASAANDAVRQWKFKPFFRNGSPEEFQTQITVTFRLP